MPHLGDYLGQLLSEIVIARAHTDLETIRVAELYASHPHLKHFPVPHLRLPTITLDLTYAVEESEKMPEDGSPRGSIDPKAMRTSYGNLLTSTLARHKLIVNKKKREAINILLDDLAQKAKVPQGSAVALRFVAFAMTEAVTKVLRQPAAKLSKEGSAKLTT